MDLTLRFLTELSMYWTATYFILPSLVELSMYWIVVCFTLWSLIELSMYWTATWTSHLGS